MTLLEPADDAWRREVHEHQMAQLKTMREQANDLLDRMRERDSWPEELRSGGAT